MAEWLIEEGIGEDRAIRLAGATITDAILAVHDDLRPGHVEDAVLVSRHAGSPRGIARFASHERALVDRLPPEAAQGAPIRLEVTRATIMEERRSKWAQARPTTQAPRRGPSLAEALNDAGYGVRVVRRFPDCDWDDLLGEALERQVGFAGGTLHFNPTPAMTLIDIDTSDNPVRGSLAAVPAIAASLRRFGLGGSIGIDFPTLTTRADRRTVDEALAEALQGWPHERTAMNGFGFVQLVARLQRPSLLHILLFHRARACIRQVLRQAEQLEGTGVIELRGKPDLFRNWLEPDGPLLDELRRRTGRAVRIVPDPAIASGTAHAQLVAR